MFCDKLLKYCNYYSREAEHDAYVRKNLQGSEVLQVALTSNPTNSSTSSNTTAIAKNFCNEADEEDEDEDFVDEDDVEEEHQMHHISSKYPAKPATGSIPFEPYHLALSKTKVVITWWKSQKRKISVQVSSVK